MIARTTSFRLGALAAACAIACASSPASAAQAPAITTTHAAAAVARSAYGAEQLDRILAPIALHPDGVLAQILIASTHADEIVEASRFCSARAAYPPEALRRAVASELWHPSIKSLCGFDGVLAGIASDLDWTRMLGEALMGQQGDVLRTIQELRRRARNSGALVANSFQLVGVTDGYISVSPRDPQVVHVPRYDPNRVYGSWWWTSEPYLPVPWAPPARATFYWGTARDVGTGLWGVIDWSRGAVAIDVARFQALYTPVDAPLRRTQVLR